MDASGSLASVSGFHPSGAWEEDSPPGFSPVSSGRAWDPCASMSGEGAAGSVGGGVQGRGGLGTCLLLRSFCPLGMGPFWNPDANPVLLSLSPLAICFSHRSVLLLLRDRAEVGSRSRCWQPHRGCPQHSLDKAGEQLASPSTGHRREGRWVRRTRSSQGQAQCCQGPNSELLGLLLP